MVSEKKTDQSKSVATDKNAPAKDAPVDPTKDPKQAAAAKPVEDEDLVSQYRI